MQRLDRSADSDPADLGGCRGGAAGPRAGTAGLAALALDGSSTGAAAAAATFRRSDAFSAYGTLPASRDENSAWEIQPLPPRAPGTLGVYALACLR